MTLRIGAGRVVSLVVGFVLMLGAREAAAADFDPEAFFAGQSYSVGAIDATFAKPEPFTAKITGTVSNGVLSMKETYSFPDAQRAQRWSLRPIGNGAYVGTVQTETGDGVLREPRPVDGQVTPSGGTLTYDGYAPNGKDILLHFRHVMTMQPNGTLRTRVAVSKLGLPMGKADAVIAKRAEDLPK